MSLPLIFKVESDAALFPNWFNWEFDQDWEDSLGCDLNRRPPDLQPDALTSAPSRQVMHLNRNKPLLNNIIWFSIHIYATLLVWCFGLDSVRLSFDRVTPLCWPIETYTLSRTVPQASPINLLGSPSGAVSRRIPADRGVQEGVEQPTSRRVGDSVGIAPSGQRAKSSSNFDAVESSSVLSRCSRWSRCSSRRNRHAADAATTVDVAAEATTTVDVAAIFRAFSLLSRNPLKPETH